MSFQSKRKTFYLRFLFFLIFIFIVQTSVRAAIAQTAGVEIQSGAVNVQNPQTQKSLPASAVTGEASIEISGEIKNAGTLETQAQPVQPAAEIKIPAPAPETAASAPNTNAPAVNNTKSAFKIIASKNSFFITPGESFDLSSVVLNAVNDKGASQPVKVESWSADTGSINLNTYTPPSTTFKGIVNLTASYNHEGTVENFSIELNIRKNYLEERLIVLYMAVILAIIILLSINKAISGKQYFIRRIGGLNAIDEAIGRSTEMGKPVLYLTGLSDMSAISTIASISILSYVARKTAEYETSLLVPCCRSLVMNTAREVVKESYLEAGKPDAYNAENIKYITDDQFGFVSGVDGIMLREKPAANFYLGHFMAESLIYAETGNSIGAIQIAGTSEFSQIPFFVAACDYCLIGEELFAASAYLSRKPKDVGTLRGQDIAKLAIMMIIIIGVVLETIAVISPGTASSLGAYKAVFQTK